MSQSDIEPHDHPGDQSHDQSGDPSKDQNEDQSEELHDPWKVRRMFMSTLFEVQLWRMQHVTDMDEATRKAILLDLQAEMLDILQSPHFPYERLLNWMNRLSPYLHAKGVCLFRKGILCYKG